MPLCPASLVNGMRENALHTGLTPNFMCKGCSVFIHICVPLRL